MREGRRLGRWQVFGIIGLAVVVAAAAVLTARSVRGGKQHSAVVPNAPIGDYEHAVDVALRHGLRVWIDADMVERWQEGQDSFRSAVTRVAELANRPGVVGIKVADELGYQDGMDSAADIRHFLTAVSSALHSAAPGKAMLVDMLVPEFGCLPDGRPPRSAAAACAADARHAYPQLALPEVDGYLRLHAIGVLDLSTGLLPEKTYRRWGTTEDAAQRAAWQEVRRRGWGDLVRLQARKALAHPGKYDGTTAQADGEVHTFVDIPLAMGARAVDVWTWRQEYEGATYRLMNPGLRRNALWDQLARRSRSGSVLFTSMSPHSVESGLGPDLDAISKVFRDVLLPAGTG